MRFFGTAILLYIVFATGCGYVGPIVPPSPMIPARITDLAAVERGDQIVITFSTPARTQDAIPIQEFANIDLRIGVAANPFNQQLWEASAKTIPIAQRETGADKDDPKSLSISEHISAREWVGKQVVLEVRTAVKSRGHFSEWSNPVTLDVVEPIPSPVVKVEATAAGYRLTWDSVRPGMHYDVLRQGPGEKVPTLLGIAEKPEYLDGTAQWDTPYNYSVVAKLGANVESPASAPVRAESPDKFPPAVPTNVVALAGPDSVELTWNRNTEPDLKGYIVFRSTNGGPFERQGEVISLPSFSDRKVQHGNRYRYAISSVDLKNNISEKSAPVEVAF